jgi:nucleoside 2-deoxyribosyltransferase
MQYSDGSSWREDFSKFLAGMGVVIFDPYKKPFVHSIAESSETHSQLLRFLENDNFQAVRTHMKKVRAQDLSMVDRADFIISYINPEIPTFGTIEEMSWAVRMRKPVFTVIEGGVKRVPLWLTAMIPENQFFDDFSQLAFHLDSINSGDTDIDPKYWRLLKPEYR